jgi:hypothetical protein
MAVRFDRGKADQYLTAVRAGARDDVAAAFAGIDDKTARAWRRRRDFGAEVDKARADLAVLAVGTVRRDVGTDQRAARFFVETLAADSELDRLRALTVDP